METNRGKRRVLRGIVASDGMDKSITVKVERTFPHPKYRKYIRHHKKYQAHDETNQAKVGDIVEIVECRPMSKIKRWRLVSVLSAATTIDGGAA